MKDTMKKFGFGFMRLPMNGEEVDLEQTIKMVDLFMSNGFRYFDTAHGYIGGKSEVALRQSLVERYPRDSYSYTNKLTENYFEKEEDVRPFFEEQMKICGVEYFDYYLMHAQNRKNYEKFKECKAYETVLQLKEEGKIRHMGISFHDTAEILDQILDEHPEIEVVQIQFNYLDMKNPSVQSQECYEVCRKHQKPIIIMEPVKGGNLVNLPDTAKSVFDTLKGGSYASYAIRFAAGFEGVMMVLSGVSTLEQMQDNISFMKDFQVLSPEENKAVNQVAEILQKENRIPCTSCRYCIEVCPQNIEIPHLFEALNAKRIYGDWSAGSKYKKYTQDNGKASDCIACRACEQVCPQNIIISEELIDVASVFEN